MSKPGKPKLHKKREMIKRGQHVASNNASALFEQPLTNVFVFLEQVPYHEWCDSRTERREFGGNSSPLGCQVTWQPSSGLSLSIKYPE
jgi:hypothetical protein